jgi:hypothetical protein
MLDTSRVLCVGLLLAALAGCGGRAPPEPIEYTAKEFVVPAPVRDVYARLRGRMDACPSTYALFASNRIEGSLASDRRSARVAVVRPVGKAAEALWGANLSAAEDGKSTKVATFRARARGLPNVDWLMRAWAEGRDPGLLQDGFDFMVC